jgi:hypothetical protein
MLPFYNVILSTYFARLSGSCQPTHSCGRAHNVNPKVARTGAVLALKGTWSDTAENNQANRDNAERAYNLIMKDKEKLLGFETKPRCSGHSSLVYERHPDLGDYDYTPSINFWINWRITSDDHEFRLAGRSRRPSDGQVRLWDAIEGRLQELATKGISAIEAPWGTPLTDRFTRGKRLFGQAPQAGHPGGLGI